MRKTATTLLLLFILTDLSVSQIRNTTYRDLLLTSEQPNIFVDYISLPGINDESLFAVSFRMDYELLPFRRIRPGESKPDNESEYTTAMRMSLEIFNGNSNSRRQGYDPVARGSWADTAWASSYEETRSRLDHIEGFISTSLSQGDYSLIMQMNLGETINESRSRERNFTVPDFQDTEDAVIAILDSVTEQGNMMSIRLYNFGEFILYGENYHIMILLPDGTSDDREYDLTIHRLESGSNPEIEGEPLFTRRITSAEISYTDGFRADAESEIPEISFEKRESGYPLLITEIPNSDFPNTSFRISVNPVGSDSTIAEKDIYSKWIGMPVSLLNLDVSINMLQFIVNEETVRQINRGSTNERESKFRQFWTDRDPTPNTEFNELMTEFYRRIDFSYENFTTPERPGYDSDQGRSYIRMGPPLSINRTYPTDGPTREIWEYTNQTLIFEATSGFGDFRLVGTE